MSAKLMLLGCAAMSMCLASTVRAGLAQEAGANGWTEVRWVTTADNARAMRVYDKLAERSDLVTYRMSDPT